PALQVAHVQSGRTSAQALPPQEPDIVFAEAFALLAMLAFGRVSRRHPILLLGGPGHDARADAVASDLERRDLALDLVHVADREADDDLARGAAVDQQVVDGNLGHQLVEPVGRPLHAEQQRLRVDANVPLLLADKEVASRDPLLATWARIGEPEAGRDQDRDT